MFYAVVWHQIDLNLASKESWFNEKDMTFEKFELDLKTRECKRTVLYGPTIMEFPV